ncbi:hypothetical protein [Rhodocaloribacter sp.]
MNLRSPFQAIALLTLLPLIGCGRTPDAAPDATGVVVSEAERDSVLSALRAVDRTAFDHSFEALQRYSFTRHRRTEQFDGDDRVIAFTERVVRFKKEGDGHRAVLVQADSGGAFDYGFFNRFVPENVKDVAPVDLAPYLLPEDPPYLLARNRDAFDFRFLPDTLLWDVTARAIEVRARPGTGDEQSLRHVRLYVDRNTGLLIALAIERTDRALLFREESRYFVHLRPTPRGDMVPHTTRYRTRIRTPFHASRQFRTTATYYEFEYAP